MAGVVGVVDAGIATNIGRQDGACVDTTSRRTTQSLGARSTAFSAVFGV